MAFNVRPDLQPPGNSPYHKKQKAKARRLRNQSAQADGALSDSVLPSMASPRANDDANKQRQQSVTFPAQAVKNNAQKQRPASMGGNMLPATPVKEQAYAGPTFQASPAASALPIPKFFSKSVPNVAKHSASLDARVAGQKTPEQDSSPEPECVSPQPPSRATQQSPLDLFFNAQKAENQRSASMQSPEMKAKQTVPPATEPRNPFQQNGKSVFLRELDGDSDSMTSPKTVPPKNRNDDSYSQQTKQLKDLLFNVSNTPPQQTAVTPPQDRQSTPSLQSPEQPYTTPSPTQRSTSGPSTPTPSAEQQNHYSLHYGNRNLSPLFKAARGSDTPPRPSNLRQHSSASDSSPVSGQQQQQPQIHPNSFSRTYLDQHIRASPPATMPNIPGMNVYPQRPYQPAAHPPPSTSSSQQGVPASSAGSGASPRIGSNGSKDLRSMEDDLRRMLKVNVLGN